MSMNPELKAKWVAALRSGEYEQITGSLKEPDGYCCLGVLCEVMGIDWSDPKVRKHRLEVEELPPVTHKVLSDDVEWELSIMNDGGVSFTDLADYIEENL